MDQTQSKWTRWIVIALCALALNAARRHDEVAGPRETTRPDTPSDQSAPQGTKVASQQADQR